MAKFNPEVQVPQAAEYTSDSKGFYTTGEAVGVGLKGLGNVAEGAINTVDAVQQDKIQKELYKGTDQILGEEGFDIPADATPQDLKSALDKISLTRKAYLNGTISESNFQFKVDALSKSVRARYPGYRDVIDTQLGRILGQSTANDLRKELYQQWSKEAQDYDEAKKDWERTERYYSDKGALPPDYSARKQAGNPYSKEYTELYANTKMQEFAAREREYAEVRHKISLNQWTVTQGIEGANREAQVALDIRVGDGLSMISDEAFIQQHDTNNNKTLDPTELDAAYGPLEAQVRTQVMSQLAQRPDWYKLNDADRKGVEANIDSRLKALRDLIYNEQTGILGAAKRATETKQRAVNLALANSPAGDAIMKIRGINELAGNSEAFNSVLMTGNVAKDLKTAADALYAMNLSDLNNTGAPVETTKTIQELSGGQLTPESVVTGVKIAAGIMTGKDTEPEVAQAYMEKWFSPENITYLHALKNEKPEYVRKVFNTLVTPRVRDAVLNSGDPRIIQNFQDWMMGSFGAIMKRETDTLMDIQRFSDFISFDFNPATLQFTEIVDPKMVTGPASPLKVGLDLWKQSEGRKSLNALNGYLAMLQPIFEATKTDGTKALTELLEAHGVDFTQPKQGSFLSMIGAAMSKSVLGQILEKGTVELPEDAGEFEGLDPDVIKGIKEGKAAEPLKMDQNAGLRDFIAKAEKAEYNTLFGGGSAPLTDMSVSQVISLGEGRVKRGSPSSAVGRYQFLSDTLEEAVKAGVVKEDEEFSEDVQDRLADWLINEARSKGKTKEGFAKRLAGRWASLPKDASGKSYHHGDGLNEARVSWEDFLGAL